MVAYTGQLNEVPNNTDFSQDIQAGSIQLTFHFFWATDIQELYDEYYRALASRAKADPLIKGTEIRKDYEWLDLYCDEIPHATQTEVVEWLTTEPYIPQSLASLPSDMLAYEIFERCREADGIQYYLAPLLNRLVWTVDITDTEGNSISGVVRSGGWLNEQDSSWRVQFVAPRAIGRDDLGLITINVEVAENA